MTSTNREVVIYDDPNPDQSSETSSSYPVGNPRRSSAPAAPYDEPIELASPTLEIPNHDLTAGELVPIIIRLPRPRDYRPYVKVWMNDLQTRTLIDDPRLLMHFTPNQQGDLETLMRIKVPLGCLEIQFAAITINMATLQESAKVVVNRHVVPPNLPSVSLDDF